MKRLVVLLVALPLVASLWTARLPAAEDVEHEDRGQAIAAAKKYLSKAKFTLEDAITLALKKFPDGHAVEAGFEVDGDDYDYVVEIASDGRHRDVEVDAVSGEIEGVELEDLAESSGEDDENTAAKSKITLILAMNAALEALGSKDARCFQIEPHLKEGKLVYEILILAGTQAHEVWVDGTSGKMQSKKKIN